MLPVRVRAPASTANLGPGFDCAAAAHRWFARIEMCIPMYPEIAEKAAPRAKANAVFPPTTRAASRPRGRLLAVRAIAKKAARTPAMIAIVVYCRFMNARAPSRIASATSRILSDPASCFITYRVR